MKRIIYFLVIFSIFSLASAQNSDEEIANFEAVHVLGFGWIHDAALSPDNTMIAIASQQGVGVYSFPDFEIIQIFHREYSYAVIWAQNGKFLIGSGDNIYFWRLNEEGTFTEIKRLTTYSNKISLSPDEQYLVNTENYYFSGWNEMQVWRLEWSETSVERTFLFQSMPLSWGESRPAYVAESPHWDGILDIEWSPDNQHFVTVSSNRFIYWQIENDHVTWERWFDDWPYEKGTLLWSQDGKEIWYSTDEEYWDGNEGMGAVFMATQEQEEKRGFGAGTPLAWLGDNLVTTSPSGSYFRNDFLGVQIWDIDSQEMIHQLEFPYSGSFVKFSPDQQYVITSNYEQSIGIYDLQTGALVAEMSSRPINGGGYSTWLTENRILSITWNGAFYQLNLWDLENERVSDYVNLENPQQFFRSISPNGRFLALASEVSPMQIYEIHAENDDLHLALLYEMEGIFDGLLWSPDSSLLTARQGETTLMIWNFHELEGLTLSCTISNEDLAGLWVRDFSPDSQQLVIGGYDAIRNYDLTTCNRLGSPILWEIEPRNYLPALAWSPNGQIIAYSYFPDYEDPERPQVRLIDAKTGNLLQTSVHADGYGPPYVLNWSPDNRYLVFGNGSGVIDLVQFQNTNQILNRLVGHYFNQGDGGSVGSIDRLTWSPSGERLLSHASDGTIQIWGVAE